MRAAPVPVRKRCAVAATAAAAISAASSSAGENQSTSSPSAESTAPPGCHISSKRNCPFSVITVAGIHARTKSDAVIRKRIQDAQHKLCIGIISAASMATPPACLTACLNAKTAINNKGRGHRLQPTSRERLLLLHCHTLCCHGVGGRSFSPATSPAHACVHSSGGTNRHPVYSLRFPIPSELGSRRGRRPALNPAPLGCAPHPANPSQSSGRAGPDLHGPHHTEAQETGLRRYKMRPAERAPSPRIVSSLSSSSSSLRMSDRVCPAATAARPPAAAAADPPAPGPSAGSRGDTTGALAASGAAAPPESADGAAGGGAGASEAAPPAAGGCGRAGTAAPASCCSAARTPPEERRRLSGGASWGAGRCPWKPEPAYRNTAVTEGMQRTR